jgi:hypothetical protein
LEMFAVALMERVFKKQFFAKRTHFVVDRRHDGPMQ